MYTEYKVRVYSDRVEWSDLDNKRHRVDGPAVEWTCGYKEWWLNGKLHRADGPAIEYENGIKSWYLNGKKLTEAEHKAQTQSCEGKVVEIDGKKFKLVEV